MVNIPPIPPLLCSTPPPIDFGEDDEDLDIMPASLGDVEDDFGAFLLDDGIKTDEPLPSPRPSSVCDLPPISIYDGLIPSNVDLSNQTMASISPTIDTKNKIKSKNLTEAFNFNVRNNGNDGKTVKQDETESSAKENEYAKTDEAKVLSKLEEAQSNDQPNCMDATNHSHNFGFNKNIKDLKIDSLNDELKCKINITNIDCMPSVVSIEDIEDDISDDELYSPRTPKNFVESDNLADFFKIEEIKTQNSSGNNLKQDYMASNLKTLESEDNKESASLQNEIDVEIKSFSSNSFNQNQFNMPPPLPDDSNSIDDYDDFGDFADFQETHFVNNTVPVKDVYNNEVSSNLETNDEQNSTKDFSDSKNSEIVINKIDHTKEENEFKDLNNDNSSIYDNFEVKTEDIYENKTDLKTTQEFENYENSNYTKNENETPIKQSSHEENSFSDLSESAEINDNEDFGNFAEFSSVSLDDENVGAKTIEIKETTKEFSNQNDEFNDFADFESHKNDSKSEKADHLSSKDDVNNSEEDDDDFGDFNTAEPLTLTTSNPAVGNPSQIINLQIPVIASNNLNERISKILHVMFILSSNPTEEDSENIKANKLKNIPFTSIDAAKALEYQWLNSTTRHSFIRSLGIDSRNILYGDNWNPLLPRFAANLSFNPLKPMKPVQMSCSTGDSNTTLESTPFNSSATKQKVEVPQSAKSLDLDWKSSITEERKIEAFTENNFSARIDAATPIPYITNESSTTEPESLAIFENSLDNEEKFSKTPPISEMESIPTFSSSLPVVTIDMELNASQTKLEENPENSPNLNEVVATSTFTGSFKETHIYTQTKAIDSEIKHDIATPTTSSSSPTKSSPIDFDYEKAAMGVIIDETVVKKEYRDVEYNPPFSMESLNKSVSPKVDLFEANSYVQTNLNNLNSIDNKEFFRDDQEDSNDDFSEFQSVSSEVTLPPEIPRSTPSRLIEASKSSTVSHGGMILSPAILIPQAISMENQKPKIEWGDSTATINPEELARIEELFPEPKSVKSSNSSQKSTPTHQKPSTPSISATVANKELEGNISNINDDDDDWSDFVSVTVANNISGNRIVSNNNVLAKSTAGSPFQQRSSVVTNKIPPATHSISNNDDEWSDFVSSAPALQQPNGYRVPQFNSGAWQNANFYNNPLSMYHRGPLNLPTPAGTTHSTQKYLSNNNNNNNYNISQQPYPNKLPSAMMPSNHQSSHNSLKQQIHVMQNFSTAPVPTPERLSVATAAAKNNQFQSIGSAKVAPSIALIPDLGFVAPAIPTHTSFINSLPKPNNNMKK